MFTWVRLIGVARSFDYLCSVVGYFVTLSTVMRMPKSTFAAVSRISLYFAVNDVAKFVQYLYVLRSVPVSDKKFVGGLWVQGSPAGPFWLRPSWNAVLLQSRLIVLDWHALEMIPRGIIYYLLIYLSIDMRPICVAIIFDWGYADIHC